jgi:hypothetical protein
MLALMLHSPPLALSSDDKLDALRHVDEFRFWHSLDDERWCKRCQETITGRQILVLERSGTRGGMRLQCPTPGCASAPSEWIYVNPVSFAALETRSAGPRSPHDDVHAASLRYRQTQNPENDSPHHRRIGSFLAVLARLSGLRLLATGLARPK